MLASMNPHAAVLSLLAADWTETRIAEAAGVGQSTINRIKHCATKRVGFELGQKLIALAVVHGAKPEAADRAA